MTDRQPLPLPLMCAAISGCMGIGKERTVTACMAVLHGEELGAMLYFVDWQLDKAVLLRSSLLPGDDDGLIVDYLIAQRQGQWICVG